MLHNSAGGFFSDFSPESRLVGWQGLTHKLKPMAGGPVIPVEKTKHI